MASVFKRKRTVNGKVIEARRYTIQYIDGTGAICRVPGFTDRGKTWSLAEKLEKGATDGEWLKHRKTPLTEHLKEFKKHLEAQNDTPKHVKTTETRVKRIIEGCGFQVIRDVRLAAVTDWLATQRHEGEFGIKTSNYHGRDLKSFCSWLVDAGRADGNPMAKFNPLNAEPDGKRERRAITADQFANLVKATSEARTIRGLSGPDRAMLYVVAAYTGLRAGELASLTADSFRPGRQRSHRPGQAIEAA